MKRISLSITALLLAYSFALISCNNTPREREEQRIDDPVPDQTLPTDTIDQDSARIDTLVPPKMGDPMYPIEPSE